MGFESIGRSRKGRRGMSHCQKRFRCGQGPEHDTVRGPNRVRGRHDTFRSSPSVIVHPCRRPQAGRSHPAWTFQTRYPSSVQYSFLRSAPPFLPGPDPLFLGLPLRPCPTSGRRGQVLRAKTKKFSEYGTRKRRNGSSTERNSCTGE